jgi:hypothetical protein
MNMRNNLFIIFCYNFMFPSKKCRLSLCFCRKRVDGIAPKKIPVMLLTVNLKHNRVVNKCLVMSDVVNFTIVLS